MLKNTKLYRFYDQVKQEAYRITWPSRKEVVTSTLVVMAAVAVFSICCLVLDYGIHNFVQFVLNIGK
ncbi:MAG UNVERIFIED_CONTAM: preprotein translocase subunit SecE [Rickettsiaceae bacterium]|jgi:preprotein translocase subunit SecE